MQKGKAELEKYDNGEGLVEKFIYKFNLFVLLLNKNVEP